MTKKTIIIMLLIGLFSVNSNAAPNEELYKKAVAFLLLASTQLPAVACKALENIGNYVNANSISNSSENILAKLLQQNDNIESQVGQLTSIAISSLVFTVATILLICYTNYRCKLSGD